MKKALSPTLSQPVPWGASLQTSKSIITPFSKKDLFYGGSVQKLMKNNGATSTWDEYRHLLLSTPRYQRISSAIYYDILLAPKGTQC